MMWLLTSDLDGFMQSLIEIDVQRLFLAESGRAADVM